VFSAPIYIRGSVKIYAAALKLDTAALLATLAAELGRTEKFSEPPPLTEESKTALDHLMYWLAKLNWRMGVVGIAAVAIVLIVLLAGLAWRHHKHSHSTVNLPPAVYQATNSGETLPLPKR
jgi:cytoskeletal protein RodZ